MPNEFDQGKCEYYESWAHSRTLRYSLLKAANGEIIQSGAARNAYGAMVLNAQPLSPRLPIPPPTPSESKKKSIVSFQHLCNMRASAPGAVHLSFQAAQLESV